MICFVRLLADFPQIGLEGLFATGGVLLRLEGLAVLRDRHQIGHAGGYHLSDVAEFLAAVHLCGGNGFGAVVRAYHVDTGTNGVGGFRNAVRCQECILVIRVRFALFRAFAQKAGYVIDTFCPCDFCHLLAWAETSHDCVIRNHLYSAFVSPCASSSCKQSLRSLFTSRAPLPNERG